MPAIAPVKWCAREVKVERPCIVVVEDDQRYRELIGHIFQGRGYRIVTAGTGREP